MLFAHRITSGIARADRKPRTATFRAGFSSALCLVVLAGCGDDPPTATGTGQLLVPITGLPPEAHAAVTVSATTGSTVRTVLATELLDEVPQGSYTIVAQPVVWNARRYVATPATQSVDVAAVTLNRASLVQYQVASATLSVGVEGLPGIPGSVNVTGPAGYSRVVLTASETLGPLEPGLYTITAPDHSTPAGTFRPDRATQTVTLAVSADIRDVKVFYLLGDGTLDVSITGLPPEVGASVRVRGPGGYDRTLSQSARLQNLPAGTYSIDPVIVGNDLVSYRPGFSSTTVAVAGGSTSTILVQHATAPLALEPVLVAEGLTEPVFVAAPAGDARVFIVQRNGVIRVMKDGALLPTPFFDATARVNFTGERGLLSMAFDPRYDENGFAWIYYVDKAGDITLEKVLSTPGSDVASGSGGVHLTIAHKEAEHHGGQIAFGPDGMLYLAPGDGRCCGDPFRNAQNLTSRLGKILRLDLSEGPPRMPVDNPYYGRFGGDDIWASGLRNAWRFAFDPPTGMLYVTDVGQDAREEVNVVPASAAGLNYGWPLMEGTACFDPPSGCNTGAALTLPLVEYTHSEGCSVTGGYVYRGRAIPELTGHYLYSDYCRGWLRSFRRSANGTATMQRTWPGFSKPRAVSFGQDGAGELYLIADGKVWRIARSILP